MRPKFAIYIRVGTLASQPKDSRDKKITGILVTTGTPVPRDSRNPKKIRNDKWGPRDSRDSRDPRDPRDPRDSRDPRDPRDHRDLRDHRDSRDPRDSRDHRDHRDIHALL